jgi:ADP-ribosylglycohydrolase
VERERFDGADIAARIVALYQEGRIIGRAEQDREAVNRLLTGKADWQGSGSPVGRVSMTPALRAVPLGLLLGGDAEGLYRDAVSLARITHKDPRSRAAAVGMAAAIAHLAEVEHMDSERFTRHLATSVRPADEGTATALEDVGRWAADRGDLDALAQASASLGKGTPRPDEGEGARGAQVLLAALVAFLRSEGDFLACVGHALKAGGETGQTAGLAGALSGAYTGAGGLPRHFAESVTDRGANGRGEILALAGRLHSLRTRGR